MLKNYLQTSKNQEKILSMQSVQTGRHISPKALDEIFFSGKKKTDVFATFSMKNNNNRVGSNMYANAFMRIRSYAPEQRRIVPRCTTQGEI